MKQQTKKILAIVLLVVVAVLGGLTVYLSTKINQETAIAPNAPESEPAAAESEYSKCVAAFVIPGITSTKTAYKDDSRNTAGNYYLDAASQIARDATVYRNQVIVYAIRATSPDGTMSARYVDYLDKRVQYVDGPTECTHTAITNLATASGIVKCDLGTINMGKSSTKAFRVKILANAALGDLFNGALVTASNGTTSWSDTNHKITETPEITATKKAYVNEDSEVRVEIPRDSVINRGQTFIYAVHITAAGADITATFADYLDRRLEYVDSVSDCTYSPTTDLATASGLIKCNYGTITKGQTVFKSFRVRLADNAALGDLYNGALVTAGNGATIWADTNHKITETPNVTATKKAYKNEASNTAGNYTLTTEISQVTANQTFVYTIEAKNSTSAVANNVVLTDDLIGENQDKLTYVDGVSACNYESSTKRVRCEGNIPANSSVKFSFRVKTASNLVGPMTIKNVGIVKYSDQTVEVKKDLIVPTLVVTTTTAPTDTITDAPTNAPTNTATTAPTVLPETGIFDVPGVAAFAGGLLLAVLGILLAL